MKQANLKAIKLDLKDIKTIEPAYFSIPGDLYEEQNVASRFHPCGGSIGVFVMGTDGFRRSIEEIFYYDYNVNKKHYVPKADVKENRIRLILQQNGFPENKVITLKTECWQ